MANKASIKKMREIIGNNIKIRRQELKLTQEQLAVKCGIRSATVIDIEHGRPCELNTLLTIMDAMDVGFALRWKQKS